jgi:cytoskeleton protein RodZ
LYEIGPQLRAAREAREISLEQAEEETKIRKKYLEALEHDNPEVIPGDVYVKGFLRSYANYLGLDGARLVEQYKERQAGAMASPAPMVEASAEAVAEGPVRPVRSAPKAPAKAPLMRPRRERHKPGPAGLPIILAVGVVALAVAGYLVLRGLGHQSAAPLAPASQGAGSPTGELSSSISTGTTSGTKTGPSAGAGTAPGTASGIPASTESPSAKVTMNKPNGQLVRFDVSGAGPIEVELQFTPKAQVWMEVTVDGKVVATQTTTDPAKTRWTGKMVSIRLGNAESLEAIKVNGEVFTRPLQGGPFTLSFAPHA